MGIPPDLGNITIPEPRYGGIPEINFGDQWRARYVKSETLPKGAPVLHIYAVVLMGDRGYATRKAGTNPWWAVEAAVAPGQKPEAALKEALKQQVGATAGKVVVSGYLECRATSHNAEYPAGAISVRPLYTVAAKRMQDVPEGSGYERRRMPINEYAALLRRQYEQMDQHFVEAIDRYIVMRAKGEL
jgi:hypothetical protein